MTLDRKWLLGVARGEREALGRTIQYTPPEYWESTSPAEAWERLRDILAHLAANEVSAAALVGDEEATELEEYGKSLPKGEPFSAEGFNRWAVERRADQGHLTLALDWGRAADLLLSRASQLSDDDWNAKVVTWLAGDIKVGYLVQSRVAEWWIHGEDFRTGGRLPPRVQHPPIFVTNDLAVRMIPYALEVAGVSFPGRTVRIDLTAAGGGEWHQGLERGHVPEDGRPPDAWITGRADAFAMVAANRVDLEVCLYDGILNVGGDLEVAQTVLRTLRVFA
ncbi:MAG TPA: maleylpyruvate isomerase family mycothiol-dependent enzyme [Actinomycetota bacterium]|nr:maleylpyruvate isomerase family mycothiol-dependent enzyme [Actinomycetota bacterium]